MESKPLKCYMVDLPSYQCRMIKLYYVLTYCESGEGVLSTKDPTGCDGGGGTQPFFQVRMCGPDFRSVGLAN